MKLNTVKRDIVSSGTMEVSTAKIKASAKIFDMFADQTYANKPVAILRELVANGVDAHTAAGKSNVPVEITMPTEFDQMFKVKDFGVGMSHDFVMGPFMEYTNGSTKDQANDQIGGFGIGSKSPFAYCDQFTLRVVHEGVLSVYTMFKNEESIPSIGLQAQVTTDEPNGVEVSFPVELDDMEDFRSAAQSALQYFMPLPIVHNGELVAPKYTHISKNKTWAMKADPDGTLGIIMGGVRYPVTSDALPYDLRNNSKLSPLLNYGIDLTLPIGACSVAMSREALSYTPHTNKAIETALQAIVDEVAKTFAHLFDKHKTKWDAQKGLYDHLSAISGHGYAARNNPRAQMLKAHAKWKGQQLELETDLRVARAWDFIKKDYVTKYPKNYPENATYWVAFKSSWSTRFPSTKFVKVEDLLLTPGKFKHVVIDDMEIAPKSRTSARIEQFVGKHGIVSSDVIVFRAEKNQDAASIKKLLDYIGNPSVSAYTSKLPEPPRAVRVVATASGAVMVRPKVRMIKFTGGSDRAGNEIINLTPGMMKKAQVKELDSADQPTSGIVYVTENWNLPADFRKKMLTGLVPWDDLVFVLKGDYPAIKDNFKTFDSVFEPKFKAYAKKYDKAGELLWFYNEIEKLSYNSNLDIISDLVKMKGGLSAKNQDTTKPFWKFVALCEQYLRPYNQETMNAVKVLDIKETPIAGVNLSTLEKAIETTHPMLNKLFKLGYSQALRKAENIPLIVNNL